MNWALLITITLLASSQLGCGGTNIFSTKFLTGEEEKNEDVNRRSQESLEEDSAETSTEDAQRVDAPAPVGGVFLTCEGQWNTEGGLESHCKLDDQHRQEVFTARATDSLTSRLLPVREVTGAGDWQWVIEVSESLTKEGGFIVTLAQKGQDVYIFPMSYDSLRKADSNRVPAVIPSRKQGSEGLTSKENATPPPPGQALNHGVVAFAEAVGSEDGTKTVEGRCFALTGAPYIREFGHYEIDFSVACQDKIVLRGNEVLAEAIGFCLSAHPAILLGSQLVIRECDQSESQAFEWAELGQRRYLRSKAAKSLCVGEDAYDTGNIKYFYCPKGIK